VTSARRVTPAGSLRVLIPSAGPMKARHRPGSCRI
jgi:hypothetical protein